MSTIQTIFSKKFKQSSTIYLTINDERELRKQLKNVFSDVWYLDYCYDFAIINLDINYLENKLNSRVNSLLINYSDRIDDFNNILDFIICIVDKIKNTDEFLDIENIYLDSDKNNFLTVTELYRLKKITYSTYFQPLLKALDLPHISNDGHIVLDTNLFFSQDLLKMIDQHAVYRMQAEFLSSYSC